MEFSALGSQIGSISLTATPPKGSEPPSSLLEASGDPKPFLVAFPALSVPPQATPAVPSPTPNIEAWLTTPESVQVEYDPRRIGFRELLDVFWANHDPRQVYGQGPDVGNQYRSIIFCNGTEESKMAALSKEQEQTRSRSSIVTTQILQLGTFYPAEPEHQKFELKQNPFLLQLIGNLPQEELEKSTLATKLNGYVAELCPPDIQRHIDAKINDIIKKRLAYFEGIVAALLTELLRFLFFS